MRITRLPFGRNGRGHAVKYGYARVSTEDQNPAMQLAALKKAGCAKLFKDEVTGAHVNENGLSS